MRFSIMLIAILSSSITMFIFCYFGKMATDAYFAYGDLAYETNKWYTIPVKNQNYFRLIILMAQQPLCYEGLGIILNLQTFSAVRNAFWSLSSSSVSWNFNYYLSDDEIGCQLLHDVQSRHFLSVLNVLFCKCTIYTKEIKNNERQN